MTATAPTKKYVLSGERFSLPAVILLTLVALLAGWLLKTGVENRSQAFQSGGISAQIPVGWLNQTRTGSEVLHITERSAAGFGTTYIIQQEPISADNGAEQFLGMLTLERGTSLVSYKVLRQQDVLVQGRQAAEIEYVYVESDPNTAHATLPAVVHGLDYVFIQGNSAIIVTYRADASAYNADAGRFYLFLQSVNY